MIRIGAITLLPAPDASGRQVVLDPRNCVPDRVGLRIKEGLLAGADFGDVDWWHWRKEQ